MIYSKYKVDIKFNFVEKFRDEVSDFTLQLMFKELSLVEFQCNIKEYP